MKRNIQNLVWAALFGAVSSVSTSVFAQQTQPAEPKDRPTQDAKPASNVQLTFAGSFIELAGVHRERNEIASGASDTPFAALPLQNSSLYGEQETKLSAQQSRIAIKMNGDVDSANHLKAYYETDFLGSGVTANSRESNSYNLRMRQLYAAYDNDNLHFHFLAGQSWSLATPGKAGIAPDQINLPGVIDAQYTVGSNWARQPQLRIVEDINKVLWLGLSLEASQVAISGAPSLALPPGTANSVGTASAPQNGIWPGTQNFWLPGYTYAVNTSNMCAGSGLLNSTTYCSNDTRPDIIEKIALDPGWGHFEVYGLQRWFNDQVTLVNSAAPTFPAAWETKTTFAYGVGGSFILPVVPKVVDLSGSLLVGRGLGRYGSSQLPDAVVGADNGKLKPLPTRQGLVGIVIHATSSLDIYAYAGQEQVEATYIGSSGGYGNPYLANDGCKYASPTGGATSNNTPIAGTTCNGQVKRVREFTIGFWDNLYKGEAGRFAFGAQYENVQNELFATNYMLPNSAGIPLGVAYANTWNGKGTPNAGLKTDNHIVYFSVRYYPY